MHFFPDHVFDSGCKAWRKSPRKRRDALKTAILTKKSKIFIKAKLTVSKSCLLELLGFMIFLHLKGWPFINHKISFYKIGKFCFLSLRSSNYIKIDRKIYISWSDNFSVYFLGFQTVCSGYLLRIPPPHTSSGFQTFS